MVLQIFTDTGQVDRDLDAVFAQLVSRTESRQHHELRRREDTGGEDDLVGRLDAMHCSLMFEFNADCFVT